MREGARVPGQAIVGASRRRRPHGVRCGGGLPDARPRVRPALDARGLRPPHRGGRRPIGCIRARRTREAASRRGSAGGFRDPARWERPKLGEDRRKRYSGRVGIGAARSACVFHGAFTRDAGGPRRQCRNSSACCRRQYGSACRRRGNRGAQYRCRNGSPCRALRSGGGGAPGARASRGAARALRSGNRGAARRGARRAAIIACQPGFDALCSRRGLDAGNARAADRLFRSPHARGRARSAKRGAGAGRRVDLQPSRRQAGPPLALAG